MVSKIYSSSYLKLPTDFYEEINPTPIANPYLVKFNHELASFLRVPQISPANEKNIYNFMRAIRSQHILRVLHWLMLDISSVTMSLFLGDGRAVLLGKHVAKKGNDGIFN